jgi:hypothetical protein
MATLSPLPIWQQFDDNGIPLDGALLYTYAAGTSTDKDTFTDSTGSVANLNPVVFDSAGRASIWLGTGAYRFILEDKNSNVIWEVDDIKGVDSVANVTSISALRMLQSGQSDLIYVAGYTLPGDGGGGWFKWEAQNAEADNGGTIIEPDAAGSVGRWVRFIENNQINPRWFGAIGNGATNDTTSFTNASDFAYYNDYDLILDAGDYLLTTNPNIRATIIFLPNAKISFANYSMTFNFIIDSNDNTQHFNATGTGGVICANESVVNATWFGTTRTDAAINKAIYSIATNDGVLRLTAGTWAIDSVINLNGIQIDIHPSCEMIISTSCAPTNMYVYGDPKWLIINAAQADVPTLLNTDIRPIWFNNDLNKCFKALPATGGNILLETTTYEPILYENTRANVRLIGKRRPSFNAGLTALTDGTIIKGPFSIDSNNIELYSLGVDSGVDVCAELYDEVPNDAIIFRNSTGDFTNPPKKGIIVKNVSALCMESPYEFHACLIEYADKAIIDDVYTCFGVYGIAFEGTNSTISNVFAKNHAYAGVMVKNGAYAPCSQVMLSNINIVNDGFTTGGLTLDNSEATSDLENISVNNLQCLNTWFGVRLVGNTNPTYTIKNVTITSDIMTGMDANAVFTISDQVDATTISFVNLMFYRDTTGNIIANKTLRVTNLESTGSYYTLNKAHTDYFPWIERSEAGSETLLNMYSLGNIDIWNAVNIRNTVVLLNKVTNGWLSLLTRDITGSEAVANLTNIGSVNMAGNLTLQGTWNGGHLVLGTYHFWVDSIGQFRFKNGAPTSNDDGYAFAVT